ncbi:ndufs4 NADH dehydrogenase Fe-S protein subunit [Pleodorina starrii]|uniref:Ndufs4 NADH dehydrogenase Fe-S protein subunit n=1 Tax=Pleodorina starrii TaxID=330485 RepID=A0A9W6F544_9CHLO|nr:ndufs4 NADH dehydrogenase Fe-S protein subunit [Pleodorina starrii]GLC56594.1 ndufs4 NADH dehydrogenase Fe-S protein subunit [Pleodorina starrii]GLC76182.1 ndufs4 NADH dehydrogenase Fe-S protein subunit [Pleodorina starrii]
MMAARRDAAALLLSAAGAPGVLRALAARAVAGGCCPCPCTCSCCSCLAAGSRIAAGAALAHVPGPHLVRGITTKGAGDASSKAGPGEAPKASPPSQPTAPPSAAAAAAAAAVPPPPPTATPQQQQHYYASDYSIALRLAQQLASRSGDGTAPPMPRGAAGLLSGLRDVDLAPRRVLIFPNARNPEQQGRQKTAFNRNMPSWSIEFLDVTDKWVNPLMGWTSTPDTKHQAAVALQFYTAEEAIAFCDRQGWDFEVEQPHLPREGRGRRWATYGDNFSIKRHGLPDLSHLPSNRPDQQTQQQQQQVACGGDLRRKAETYGAGTTGGSN